MFGQCVGDKGDSMALGACSVATGYLGIICRLYDDGSAGKIV